METEIPLLFGSIGDRPDIEDVELDLTEEETE